MSTLGASGGAGASLHVSEPSEPHVPDVVPVASSIPLDLLSRVVCLPSEQVSEALDNIRRNTAEAEPVEQKLVEYIPIVRRATAAEAKVRVEALREAAAAGELTAAERKYATLFVPLHQLRDRSLEAIERKTLVRDTKASDERVPSALVSTVYGVPEVALQEEFDELSAVSESLHPLREKLTEGYSFVLELTDAAIRQRLHDLESSDVLSAAPEDPSETEETYSAAHAPMRALRTQIADSLKALKARRVEGIVLSTTRATVGHVGGGAASSPAPAPAPAPTPAPAPAPVQDIELIETDRGMDPDSARPTPGLFEFSDYKQNVKFPSGPCTVFSAVSVPGKAGSVVTWTCRMQSNSSWMIGFISNSSPAARTGDALYSDRTCTYGLANSGLAGGHLPRENMHDKEIIAQIDATANKATIRMEGRELRSFDIPASQFPLRLAICGFMSTRAKVRLSHYIQPSFRNLSGSGDSSAVATRAVGGSGGPITPADEGFDERLSRVYPRYNFAPFTDSGRTATFPWGPSTIFSAITVPGKAGSVVTWNLRMTGNNSWAIGAVPKEDSSAMSDNAWLSRERNAKGIGSSSTGNGLPQVSAQDKVIKVCIDSDARSLTFTIDGCVAHTFSLPASSFPVHLGVLGYNGTQVVARITEHNAASAPI